MLPDKFGALFCATCENNEKAYAKIDGKRKVLLPFGTQQFILKIAYIENRENGMPFLLFALQTIKIIQLETGRKNPWKRTELILRSI